MRKYFFLTFILFTIVKTSFSQKNSYDSILINKVHFYKNINPDSTIFFSKKLESSDNLCSQIAGSFAIIYVLYRQNKYPEAIKKINILDSKIDSISRKEKLPCFF